MSNNLSRSADTRDLRLMEDDTENIYLSAVIISKRANQISITLIAIDNSPLHIIYSI